MACSQAKGFIPSATAMENFQPVFASSARNRLVRFDIPVLTIYFVLTRRDSTLEASVVAFDSALTLEGVISVL